MQKWYDAKDPERVKQEKERVTKTLFSPVVEYAHWLVHDLCLPNLAA